MQLEGKRIVLAGAGAGMGKAAALAYAREGAEVFVISRSDGGKEIAESILQFGGKAHHLACDLTQDQSLNAVFKTIAGSIDVLHFNAGTFHMALAQDLATEDWRHMQDTNLSAAFYSVRAALPYFSREGGSIILTAAAFGVFQPMKKLAHYNASKAGVAALAQTLALELAERNIRVNCICPGQVAHQFHDAAAAAQGRFVTPKKVMRGGCPEDIAPLAVYLASDASAWMTGAVIPIDGGWHVGVRT